MNIIFRSYLLFIISIALLFPAKRELDTTLLNSKIHTQSYKNTPNPVSYRQMQKGNSDKHIIWWEDFENGAENWLIGDGWELTQDNFHSEGHSMLSPNDNTTVTVEEGREADYYTLFSPTISLPDELGVNELFTFTFWLLADIPDSDGNNDGDLEDYYELDIQASSDSSAWHHTGSSYWCGIEENGGYEDGWLQFLDTQPITIPEGATLQAEMKWAIEDTVGAADADVSEGWIDGWDAVNVRISDDGGLTWELLIGDDPYDFYSGYGWVYNGAKAGENGTHSLASGWSGDEDWHNVEFDLIDYSGQDVIIRFAFGSDPAYSTIDNDQLKGIFLNDITITDDAGMNTVLYTAEDAYGGIHFDSSSYLWADIFHDYHGGVCKNSLEEMQEYSIKGLCEEAGFYWDSRPGSYDWEEYQSGMAYNSNIYMDISSYAGEEIVIKFTSWYDDNDDGGVGTGLFIDDFTIYKKPKPFYFAPPLYAGLNNGDVELAWYDLNESGDKTFIFDSGSDASFSGLQLLDDCIECVAYAGTVFPVFGESSVDSILIYNINTPPVDVVINAYDYWDMDPLKTLNVILSSPGWNSFDVEWNFSSVFFIAHSFTDLIYAAYDMSSSSSSLLVLDGDTDLWQEYKTDEIHGNWGIRAKIAYEGIDVKYNIYRGEEGDEILNLIASDLTNGSYIDNNVEYNTVYYYSLGVVYPNGYVEFSASGIAITTPMPPLPDGVSELLYDDDSFEGEFNAGGSNYSAVKFTTGSEIKYLYMVKWYQVGDGGVFHLKIFDDNNGAPGNEIYSKVQASGNEDGWNQKVLASEIISISGSFWVGAKEFSSSQPFGLDSTSISGFSYQREGENGEWLPIEGNLAIRAYLSSEPLSINSSEIPYKYGIQDIYPNPFNPITNIQFEISEFTQVTLSIYDLNGRLLKILLDDKMNPGQYLATWNGIDRQGYQVSSGIYLAVIEAGRKKVQTRKMVLLK